MKKLLLKMQSYDSNKLGTRENLQDALFSNANLDALRAVCPAHSDEFVEFTKNITINNLIDVFQIQPEGQYKPIGSGSGKGPELFAIEKILDAMSVAFTFHRSLK